jgi:tetratricopeptide (TPR) repeat protein
MRLSPFDQQAFTFLTTAGTAALVLGRYEEAVAWYGKARRANPRYRAAWRMLAAALALAGEAAEARAQAAEFMQFDPGFRIADFASWYAMREPHLGTVLRGMRAAGLPD